MNALISAPKKWYLSKTILVQVLGGVALIAGQFYAPAQTFIQSHFSELGGGWMFINVILRLITKKEIA
jgi:hypothetical protein